MRGKIWVLFSIKDEPKQPVNNLVAWWYFKPSLHKLGEVVKDSIYGEKSAIAMWRIIKGLHVKSNGILWILKEVTEGRKLDEEI